ncbi:YLP motif-containing protein 1 [Tanacetum coccineum]
MLIRAMEQYLFDRVAELGTKLGMDREGCKAYNRFVRFVSTPDVLKLVSTYDAEILAGRNTNDVFKCIRPVVIADGMRGAAIYERLHVRLDNLDGEIIRLERYSGTIQVNGRMYARCTKQPASTQRCCASSVKGSSKFADVDKGKKVAEKLESRQDGVEGSMKKTEPVVKFRKYYLKGKKAKQVDMDMEDEDAIDASQGFDIKSPLKDVRHSITDIHTEEVNHLSKSKWSNDLDGKDPIEAEGEKKKTSALSGLLQAYSKEGKSVTWGD